jgi:hypothetical protein
MMSVASPDTQARGPEEGELAEYRPVCIPAIAGSLLALASPMALLHPVMWTLPWMAVAVCSYALHVIGKSEPMSGRRAAQIGLVFSLLLAVWAPARSFTYDRLMRRDADQLALLWFELMAHNEPHKAFQLTLLPGERSPLDDKLWDTYRSKSTQREQLEIYVQQPLIRTLLALGDQAVVRKFDVQAAASDGVQMSRNLTPAEGPRAWRITNTQGGYQPVVLGGKRD